MAVELFILIGWRTPPSWPLMFRLRCCIIGDCSWYLQ